MDVFIQQIEEATGLKVGEEWGIENGTETPFPADGVLSSGMFRGFKIWKAKDGFGKETYFTDLGKEKNLENIIDFLKL